MCRIAATGVRFDAILGVSEGGVIAPDLALAHPEIPKLVIIGAGGMTERQELALLMGQGSRLPIRRALAAVAANPDSVTDRALGTSQLLVVVSGSRPGADPARPAAGHADPHWL